DAAERGDEARADGDRWAAEDMAYSLNELCVDISLFLDFGKAGWVRPGNAHCVMGGCSYGWC
ncbi:MAG TPA: hypothetical protein VKS80_14695, partial [Trinickia sp.]|nr:hypothetical protein [Trinickia sp.]